MGSVNYLLIALGISTFVYVLYRYFFLKNPKNNLSNKPHFTLKIEPE